MREENSPETFAQESSKKHFIDPEILKIWEEIEKLVQVTAERLLEERPVSELIQFIGSSNIDWKALTEEIMK